MNLKIILGIVIPLFLIVLTAILGNLDIGLSSNVETVSNLNFDDIVNNDLKFIDIQTITYTNDFFLSKKVEITNIKVCMIDSDGDKNYPDGLKLKFSESSNLINTDVPIYSDLFNDSVKFGKYVEIPANSIKKVKISIKTLSSSNPNYFNFYRQADEIAIIEDERINKYNPEQILEADRAMIHLDHYYYSRGSCTNAKNETKSAVIKIENIPPPKEVIVEKVKETSFQGCGDNEVGRNYSHKGTIVDTSDNKRYTDECSKNETRILNEWYCENSKPKMEAYTCPDACYGGKCVEDDCIDGTDECTAKGQLFCAEGYLRTCGNFDNDSCLEWKIGTSCLKGTCTDSDGGKDYFVNGTVIDELGISSDSCPGQEYGTNNIVLAEYYCENNLKKYFLYTCPNGCNKGVCIK